MLRDNISYKCQLRKLQNKKELTSDGYSKQIKEARKSGADRDELDSLAHEAHMVDLYSDHNIRAFQSRYLLKKAERYLLPIPPFDKESGNWEKSEIAARWRLTLPAHAELRSAIYDYEKGRRERIQSWSGIIGASTGLLGTLIALIAILS